MHKLITNYVNCIKFTSRCINTEKVLLAYGTDGLLLIKTEHFC